MLRRHPWLGSTIVFDDDGAVAWYSAGDGLPLRAASGSYRHVLDEPDPVSQALTESALDLLVFADERAAGVW